MWQAVIEKASVVMSYVAHLVKSFTLWEFVKAHWLTLKYFFKPKATINYPFEKNLPQPAFPRRWCAVNRTRGTLHRVQASEAICPAQAITIEAEPRDDGSPHALRYRHDPRIDSRGQEARPVDAIVEGPNSNSRPKRARNCSMTRPSCSPMATNGNARLRPIFADAPYQCGART